jgi:hypothetical protein
MAEEVTGRALNKYHLARRGCVASFPPFAQVVGASVHRDGNRRLRSPESKDKDETSTQSRFDTVATGIVGGSLRSPTDGLVEDCTNYPGTICMARSRRIAVTAMDDENVRGRHGSLAHRSRRCPEPCRCPDDSHHL